MAKVTSKLQVTVPKALAVRYGIRPGDEIEWEAAGDAIRVLPGAAKRQVGLSKEEQLRLFDRATLRQQQREEARGKVKVVRSRGWKREDLYRRGGSR